MKELLASIVFTCLLALSVFAQQQTSHTILFALDAAELDATARQTLDDIAEVAQASDSYELTLFGHTDLQGSETYNARLSAKRVAAAKDYLLRLGLEARYLEGASFGESRPKTAGETETSHASNRRVELVLSTEDITSEQQLFNYLARQYASNHSLNVDLGGSFIGDEGVQITVPPNAFLRANGDELPAGAQVDILIEEATRPSSMVAHRLNTNGLSSRLQTGGMVRVTGSYQGEELLLRQGEAIDVEMPTATVDDEMRLYLGNRTDDGRMDWALDEGESIATSTRLTGEKLAVQRSQGWQDSMQQVRHLIAKRDSILMQIKIPEGLVESRPQFPTFKEFPREFNPSFGEPKRPYVPGEPKRRKITRGSFLQPKSLLQRKADEEFIADSIAYAASHYEYEAKIKSWEKQLAEFRASTPERRAAHAAKVDEVEAHRVVQALDYIESNHRMRAAFRLVEWQKELKNRGPLANVSAKKLEASSYECLVPVANPLSVLVKAYRPCWNVEAGCYDQPKLDQDTLGTSMEAHSRELFAELGIAEQIKGVEELQSEIAEYFMTAKQREAIKLKKQADEFNQGMTAKYKFQIRTAMPTWHNCDHPIPPGEYQLLVSKPNPVSVYFSSVAQGTVDFYPPNSMAAAVYREPEQVHVVAFGYSDTGLKLCLTSALPTRNQKASLQLIFVDASLKDVEKAIASLN